MDKPRIVSQAEILLVGFALIAVAQYIDSSLVGYLECRAEDGSISAVIVTFLAVLFLRVLGGLVILEAFPNQFLKRLSRYRLWVRLLVLLTVVCALWQITLGLDEVVGWSYRSALNFAECTISK